MYNLHGFLSKNESQDKQDVYGHALLSFWLAPLHIVLCVGAILPFMSILAGVSILSFINLQKLFDCPYLDTSFCWRCSFPSEILIRGHEC